MNIRLLLLTVKEISKGSKALDREIYDAIGSKQPIKPVSTSIDAAVEFVRQIYPGRPVGFLEKFHSGMDGYAGLIGDIPGAIDLKYCANGYGNTPALAICAAALIAKGDFGESAE